MDTGIKAYPLEHIYETTLILLVILGIEKQSNMITLLLFKRL